MAEQDTNVVTFAVGGKRYDVDLHDIDGVEWRDVRHATGMKAREVIRGALAMDDFEALAGLLWIWRRRSEPELAFIEVLSGLKFSEFGDAGEEEQEADPPD